MFISQYLQHSKPFSFNQMEKIVSPPTAATIWIVTGHISIALSKIKKMKTLDLKKKNQKVVAYLVNNTIHRYNLNFV